MASTLAAHQLKVTLVEAQNLARTNDWNEGSDAFCEIKLHGKPEGGTPIKTSVQKQSLAPKWNETFTVELSHSPMNDTLEIFVWGDKLLGKVFIGRVEIPVTLLLHGAMVDGWFKLLPQTVMDMSKTVVGHIHLILHYSQVQLPAPAKTEKSTKKTSSSSSSSSAYPGNTPASSLVNCPVCGRPISALAINQHLDLCTQQSSTTTSSSTTAPSKSQSARGEVGACPVCCKTFPLPELDKHVEACLASQPLDKEPKRPHKPPHRPTSESEEDAQLQAVLIASKLEAEKLKKNQEKAKENDKTTDSTTPSDGAPSPSLTPFYPSLPYMPYPGPVPVSPAMPMGPGPFMPAPYSVSPFPDPSQHATLHDGQGQMPSMYYLPPMYPPPFYPAMGAPQVSPAPSTNQLTPYGTATTPTTQPKTDLLF